MALSNRNGIGYVVCGYLDSEGPEGITVEGDPYDDTPFETVEEAWAEIDGSGGPRENANVLIGIVLPIGVVVPGDATDEYMQRRTREAKAAFGPFFVVDEAELGDAQDYYTYIETDLEDTNV